MASIGIQGERHMRHFEVVPQTRNTRRLEAGSAREPAFILCGRAIYAWPRIATLGTVIALLVSLVGRTSPSRGDELPKAETILDRFIEATGGSAAYQRLRNRVLVSEMAVPNTSIRGTTTTYQAAPDRLYVAMEHPGRGLLERGFDGQVAWEYHPKRGARVVEGEERTSAVRNARFNADLVWREVYSSTDVLGVETVDGRECYKLRLTPKGEKPFTHYYDKETGLRLKMEVSYASAKGDVLLEILYEQYKEIDGVRIPHLTRQRAGNQEQVYTVEKIEHNVEIPVDRFVIPQSVKTLLEAQKDKPEDTKGAPPQSQDPKP